MTAIASNVNYLHILFLSAKRYNVIAVTFWPRQEENYIFAAIGYVTVKKKLIINLYFTFNQHTVNKGVFNLPVVYLDYIVNVCIKTFSHQIKHPSKVEAVDG